MNVHACAISRCERSVRGTLLTCSKHWDLVPEFYRRRLAAARRKGLDSRSYVRAAKQTIEVVEGIEAARERRARPQAELSI